MMRAKAPLPISRNVITDSDADPVAKNTVMTVAKIKLSHGDGGRDKR